MRILKTVAASCAALVLAAMPAWGQSLIRDTEIEELMGVYTRDLIVAAGLQPNDVDLYIISDPSVNAFVTRGQNIFMHTGLIMESETPNQLIGVYAHEIGHIAGAHLARSDEAIGNAAVPAYVSLGLGLIAALAGEGGAAGALMASSQQFGALSFLTYSRAQESSADQAGLQYLTATGQSGEGLVEFFERFRYQEVMSRQQRFPYFRSHPLSSQRVAALRRGVEESEFYGVEDSAQSVDSLRRIQAKIYGFTAPPEYVFYRYPEDDTSLYARYARVVAYYREARLEEARGEIESLITQEPDNPYFQELYGQMLFESGYISESIPYHQASVDMRPSAPLFRVNLAVAQLASEDETLLEDARGHLQVALNIEPDNSFAWYQLSIVHERSGETPLAKLAIAEQSFHSGNMIRAVQFAGRAREELEQGTPAWIRATEIELAARPMAEEMARRRR